jgi:hypothetical protein
MAARALLRVADRAAHVGVGCEVVSAQVVLLLLSAQKLCFGGGVGGFGGGGVAGGCVVDVEGDGEFVFVV